MTCLADYDYDLPLELIAQRPVAQRPDARLMIVQRATGEIEHAHVRDLPVWLAPSDCLVLNDSRVLPARLVGYRLVSGGRWQGLFLSADEQGNWQLLCKTRGKLQPGELIVLTDRGARDDVRLAHADAIVRRYLGGASGDSGIDLGSAAADWACALAGIHSGRTHD